ncbi:MAG: sodium:proton antiporter [Aquihabitans sp.]
MHDDITTVIAVVIFVGVGAQWVAARFSVPSVLVLLPAGILVGPVLHLVEPREVFGEALFPIVAVAVGIVLFEGGTSLQLREVSSVRRPVAGLVTVGVAVTWAVGGVGATVLLDIPADVGFLLAAVLVVSGPTVILPLLDTVRLREPVAPILRWECIVIDPIGAVLAVAVFEAIKESGDGVNPFIVLLSSASVGVLTGLVGGFGLAWLLGHHAIPDRLHSPVTFATVITCFVLANQLSVEAGLFATTVLGVVLVNQRLTPVGHIASFGEDVGVLLLGSLFVILGATVDFDAMADVLLPSLLLLIVLLLIRPAAVWLSTIGAGLRRNELLDLSLIAPRGVIAASVSALFGISLASDGVPGAQSLAPAAFIVVIGSVLFASIIARPASKWLRVATETPRGVLFVGDEDWLIDVAAELASHEVPVLVMPVGSEGSRATELGLLTFQGEADGEDLADSIDALGISQAIVAVDTRATESLLVERVSEVLGRRQVFRVERLGAEESSTGSRAWGRTAFPGIRQMVSSAGPSPAEVAARWKITTLSHTEPVPTGAVVQLFDLNAEAAPDVGDQRRSKRQADDVRPRIVAVEGS